MNPKWLKSVTLLNVTRTTTSASYTHTADRNPVYFYDQDVYDQLSAIYFTATMRAASGDTAYMILSEIDPSAGTSDITGSEVSTTSTVNVVVSSGDIKANIADGTDWLRARWKRSGSGTASFDRAMINFLQDGAVTKTETIIEIGEDNNVPGTSYSAPTDYYLFLYEAARWPDATFYYQAALHPNSSGNTAYSQLYDVTAGAAVSGSEVSHTGDTNTTRKRSSAITLVDGHVYRMDVKGSSTSEDVAAGEIVIHQSGTLGSTDIYIPILNTTTSGTGSSYAYQDRYYDFDAADFVGDTKTAKFEATLKSSSGNTAYYNLNNDTDATELAVVSTTDTSYARVRDDTVTLPTDDNNTLNSGRKIDTSGTVSVVRAFLIIQIDWSTGTAYEKNLSDTINGASSLVRSTTKVISLNLNLSSSLVKAITTVKSNTLNLASSLLKLPGKVVSENINLSSVFARVATLVRTLTDTINGSSVLTKLNSKTKSESLNLASTLTQVDIVGKFFTETISISSSLVKTVSRALQEVVDLASVATKSATKVISNTISLSSSILRAITKVISNALNLSEVFEKVIPGSVPEGVIFMWPSTNASIPAGYERVTDLDGRFIKVANATGEAGVTGGAATHTHTSVSNHSHTAQGHTHSVTINGDTGTNVDSGTSGSGATRPHTHAAVTSGAVASFSCDSVAVTYGAVSNNPPYFEVIFIRSLGSAKIPDDAIALWDVSVLPTNWNNADGGGGRPNLTDKFLRGAATSGDGGGTGGSTTNTHELTHTHSTSHAHSQVTSGAINSNTNANTSGTSDMVHSSHTHTVSLGAQVISINDNPSVAQDETVEPLHIKMYAIQNNSGAGDFPVGVIGIWLGERAEIPNGWEEFDAAQGYYIKITATSGALLTTAGSNTHSHASKAHTHANFSHNGHTVTISGHSETTRHSSNSEGGSRGDGVHPTSVGSANLVLDSANTAANSSSNEPLYTTVILIQKVATPIVLTDALNMTSSIIRSTTKVISNTISTASSILKFTYKVLSDTSNASEVFEKVFTQGLALMDEINTSSVLSIQQSLVRTLTDAINTTSALTRAVYRTLSDSIVRSSVLTLLGAVSKTLTLIYNIFAFVLGLRAKPTLLRVEPDVPVLIQPRTDAPKVVETKGDAPTLFSAKQE